MVFSKLSNYMGSFEFGLKEDGNLCIETNLTNCIGINMGINMGNINIQYLSKNRLEIVPNDLKMVESNVDILEDKLIFFKLKKTNFMKTIIDTIDKMVSEVEWVFTSNSNTNKDDKKFVGLEITCTDPSKTLFLKAKLNDSIFKSYHCAKPIFRFGMSLEFYNKIIRLVEKDDIAVYCYIEESDPDNLVIRFKNIEKKNKKIFKIPLQILSNNIIKQPLSLNFEKKISLKIDKFFNVCKMINNTSQFVEIECNKDKLLFNCVGEKEGILSYDNDDDETLDIINLDNSKVIGIYETKNILLFSKLSTITEEFSLFMKNNFALTSFYSFGEYGSISTILSPVNEEYINNLTYDYSDQSDDDDDLIQTNLNILD